MTKQDILSVSYEEVRAYTFHKQSHLIFMTLLWGDIPVLIYRGGNLASKLWGLPKFYRHSIWQHMLAPSLAFCETLDKSLNRCSLGLSFQSCTMGLNSPLHRVVVRFEWDLVCKMPNTCLCRVATSQPRHRNYDLPFTKEHKITYDAIL